MPAIAIPAVSRAQTFAISEDATWKKAICMLPYVGFIPGLIFEKTISSDISSEYDRQKAIALIEVKNEFKLASISSSLLTIIAAVILVATNVLLADAVVSSLVYGGIAIAIQGYAIYHNHWVIDQIKKDGITPGLTCW